MRKSERQKLIETLISRRTLSTQGALVASLRKLGCSVTQATISRDMREMGVRKGSDGRGGVRFFIATPRERRDPAEALAHVLRESGAGVRAAQNLLVIKSEPGTAPNVGRAVDEWAHNEIVGTVAGDDTVLMVLGDSAKAGRMGGMLKKMIQEI